MQYYINNIKKELEELANLKRERALVGMPDEFQQVFLLLPALFHYHTPELPGYMEGNIPSGIACYQLSTDTKKLLKHKFNFAPTKNKTKVTRAPAISALYSMGSTRFMGQ
jgi:adenylate cyclase, class 1